MIHRHLQKDIQNRFDKGKIILLIGPRQVGKTTLIRSMLKEENFLFLDGDDQEVVDIIAQANTTQLKSIIGNYTRIFIDEAQRIPQIGLKLKIIVDQFKGVQVFVSGSSSLDLSKELNEPLTGRKYEFNLFPISWKEYESHIGFLKAQQDLKLRLTYGMYPDILQNTGDEYELLKNLVNSYLYRDILQYGGIRKPEVLVNLLKALAYQVGSEVSYNEVAQLIGIDKKTVSDYIDLLEKCFVVFRLRTFSRNHRNEIKARRKIYFYDNGVRNMLISNFSSFDSRMDKGALWENFLVSERVKEIAYRGLRQEKYFWRTRTQQEVDYVEWKDEVLSCFEFKWSNKRKAKLPKPLLENYSTRFLEVTPENFREFLDFD